MQQRYLDTKQAAEYLGVTSRHLENIRWRGGGPAFHKLGGSVRYLLEELDAWAGEARTSTSGETRLKEQGAER